jgi:polyphenol oxidase
MTPRAAQGTQRSALRTPHSAGVPYLHFPALAQMPGLVHGVFTRAGGVSEAPFASLNVSLAVGDDRAHVLENRRRVAEALGADPRRVFGARQVHGAAWRIVEPHEAPGTTEREPCDVLLSGTPGHLLLLKFADCTPLILWDARRRWVAVAHAGWRGTAQDVAGVAVRALGAAAGSRTADLWVGIGPTIGACCYEVGPEVVAALARAVPDAAAVVRPAAGDRAYLDLVAANRHQLEMAGVPPAQIVAAARCTCCDAATFYSHRALGLPAGRFGVAAGVCA